MSVTVAVLAIWPAVARCATEVTSMAEAPLVLKPPLMVRLPEPIAVVVVPFTPVALSTRRPAFTNVPPVKVLTAVRSVELVPWPVPLPSVPFTTSATGPVPLSAIVADMITSRLVTSAFPLV